MASSTFDCADRAAAEKLFAGEDYAQAMKRLGDVDPVRVDGLG